MTSTCETLHLPGRPASFPLDLRLDPVKVEERLARTAGYNLYSIPQPVRDAIRTGIEEAGLFNSTQTGTRTGARTGARTGNQTLHPTGPQTGIRGGYLVTGNFRIHPEKETVSIEGEPFHAGKQLVSRLKNADQLALVLCTAGEAQAQRAAGHLSGGDVLAWYIAGLIGNLLASAAMEELLRKLARDAASQGYSVGGCGYPGNGAWSLSDLPRLFRLFPDGFCGVGITDGGMLSPVASLCGVAGLKRRETQDEPIIAMEGI